MADELFEAPKKNAALLGALAKAQAQAKSVEKDGFNPHHKYRYASTEAILGVVKEACQGTGLSVRPGSYVINDAMTKVTRHVVLAHETGEEVAVSIDWPIVTDMGGDGGKKRPIDKALGGALTASLGYLLRDLFMLPRVDEEDMDHPAQGAATPKPEKWPGFDQFADEVGQVAKSLLGGGLTKNDLIATARNAVSKQAVISDEGKWAEITAAEAGVVISAFRKKLKEIEAKAAPAATPKNGPAPVPVRPAAPQPAPASAASTPSPAPVTTTPAVPRDNLTKLGGVVANALGVYGSSKAEMVAKLREWAGRPDVISDEGKFPLDVSAEQYTGMVKGFKAWEVSRRETKPGSAESAAKAAEDAAEKARQEWEASAAPS